MRPSIVLALVLAAPSIALAQPAPHHTVGQVLEIEGEVFVPAGGGPMIGVNKSNTFQVLNAPFRSILTRAAGSKVKARVRVITPGAFGSRVNVERVEARAQSDLPVRLQPSAAAPVFATIAADGVFSITGATTRYFAVKLQNGRRGHVLRTGAVSIGTRATPPAGGTRLDAFEFTSYIEWGGDHVQVQLKVRRQADGTYLADLGGEDLPAARTNVPLSASAVADLVAALKRFESFPDDHFAGDGNHWHYTVQAEGAHDDGSALRFSRDFYEPGDSGLHGMVNELASTVEGIARSLSAGPVGGLVTSIPGQ